MFYLSSSNHSYSPSSTYHPTVSYLDIICIMPRVRRNRRKKNDDTITTVVDSDQEPEPMVTDETDAVEVFDPNKTSIMEKLNAGWATHAYSWAILKNHHLAAAHRDELRAAVKPLHVGRTAREDFKAQFPCPWSGLCRKQGQDCTAKLFVVEDSDEEKGTKHCVRVIDNVKIAFYSIPLSNADVGVLCGNCFQLVTGGGEEGRDIYCYVADCGSTWCLDCLVQVLDGDKRLITKEISDQLIQRFLKRNAVNQKRRLVQPDGDEGWVTEQHELSQIIALAAGCRIDMVTLIDLAMEESTDHVTDHVTTSNASNSNASNTTHITSHSSNSNSSNIQTAPKPSKSTASKPKPKPKPRPKTPSKRANAAMNRIPKKSAAPIALDILSRALNVDAKNARKRKQSGDLGMENDLHFADALHQKNKVMNQRQAYSDAMLNGHIGAHNATNQDRGLPPPAPPTMAGMQQQMMMMKHQMQEMKRQQSTMATAPQQSSKGAMAIPINSKDFAETFASCFLTASSLQKDKNALGTPLAVAEEKRVSDGRLPHCWKDWMKWCSINDRISIQYLAHTAKHQKELLAKVNPLVSLRALEVLIHRLSVAKSEKLVCELWKVYDGLKEWLQVRDTQASAIFGVMKRLMIEMRTEDNVLDVFKSESISNMRKDLAHDVPVKYRMYTQNKFIGISLDEFKPVSWRSGGRHWNSRGSVSWRSGGRRWNARGAWNSRGFRGRGSGSTDRGRGGAGGGRTDKVQNASNLDIQSLHPRARAYIGIIPTDVLLKADRNTCYNWNARGSCAFVNCRFSACGVCASCGVKGCWAAKHMP
eukprot:86340_1